MTHLSNPKGFVLLDFLVALSIGIALLWSSGRWILSFTAMALPQRQSSQLQTQLLTLMGYFDGEFHAAGNQGCAPAITPVTILSPIQAGFTKAWLKRVHPTAPVILIQKMEVMPTRLGQDSKQGESQISVMPATTWALGTQLLISDCVHPEVVVYQGKHQVSALKFGHAAGTLVARQQRIVYALAKERQGTDYSVYRFDFSEGEGTRRADAVIGGVSGWEVALKEQHINITFALGTQKVPLKWRLYNAQR